jgi:sulfite reductase (NADPH) hemoprotein beta-component
MQDHDGNWHYTVFVENGRVTDTKDFPLKTALLQIAETGNANFRFTSNQNIIVSDVSVENKEAIQSLLNQFNLDGFTNAASAFRKNAMACVALPTCPLALAEAQRYMPSFITKIEALLNKYDLQQDGIIARMTGCPNGCARPYAAEIGFVGTATGKYNLHIGGDREGTRLNYKFRESLDEDGLLQELDALFSIYKNNKAADEHFGDFVLREPGLIPIINSQTI